MNDVYLGRTLKLREIISWFTSVPTNSNNIPSRPNDGSMLRATSKIKQSMPHKYLKILLHHALGARLKGRIEMCT
jgi:hypothetical protein